MPASSTVDEFLQVIQRSGLVDPPRLDAYLQGLGAERPPPEQPGALAGLMVRDRLLTAYQARHLLAGKWQGFTILGKFKILELIGTGGMGKVFLCEHMFLRRLVAVKVLPRAKHQNPLLLERFFREARAVAALDHGNIVRCFDFDQDGPLYFMVMEYVDGASLESIVKRCGPLAISRAAHYIRQAALGLDHAHQAGWVHRDVKPANILLDRSGTIKILDLGLARLFHDSADNLTRQHDENMILGTADYMSPEQALLSHNVDIRADIYSLGATFYFVLTGVPPFHEGTAAQKLLFHQMRAPLPVTQRRPEVPRELAAVLDRMMAKDPSQRFQTPAEAAAALDPWTATPIPPPPEQEMPQLHAASVSLGPIDPKDTSFFSSLQLAKGSTPATNDPPIRPGRATVKIPRLQTSTPAAAATDTVKLRVEDNAPPTMNPAVREPNRPGDSAPSTDRHPGAAVPAVSARGEPRPVRRSARVLAVLAGLVVLAGLGGAYWQLVWKSPPADVPPAPAPFKPAPPSGRQPLVVTRNRTPDVAQRPNTFPSVALALAKAQPGDRILLLDQTYEERLVLAGGRSGQGKGVTIESGNPSGKETIWHLPADVAETVALLALTDVEGLCLKGIIFDAQLQTDDLLTVSGRCPGLKLENVQLRGFRRAAVRISSAEGVADNPIALSRLRITASTTQGAEAALVFETRAQAGLPALNRYLHIQDCRFEGPCRTAVRFDGPTAAVLFQHNRVFRCQEAFRVDLATQATRLEATITGNTLHEVRTGIALSRAARPDMRLVVQRNLFARTPALVRAEASAGAQQLRGLFVDCEGNVRDKDSGTEGLRVLAVKEMSFELPAEPDRDSHFLRYPATSSLATAGPGSTPVGVPPR